MSNDNATPEMTDSNVSQNGETGTDITKLLKQMKELQERIKDQKTETLTKFKTQLIELLENMTDIQMKLDDTLETIRQLNPSIQELKEAGYEDILIGKIMPMKSRKGRVSVMWNGVSTSASEVCRQLGLEINGDSAVRVLQRYLKQNPNPNIQFL